MKRIRQFEPTLQLECWPDELSPAQLAAYETAESEHFSIRSKLNEFKSSATTENLFLGELFAAYTMPGGVTGLEDIVTKPTVRKDQPPLRRGQQSQYDDKESRRARDTVADDVPDSRDDDTYVPGGGKRPYVTKVARLAAEKKREAEAAAARQKTMAPKPPAAAIALLRPTENTAIGGLSVGDTTRNKRDIIDLTKDEATPTVLKNSADSKEVTFNKLQGKTFPSLVVVARPSLRTSEAANDRPVLDAKVKSVLMHTATKFTEWLIQQGLVRSEQTCQVHPSKMLKLGK